MLTENSFCRGKAPGLPCRVIGQGSSNYSGDLQCQKYTVDLFFQLTSFPNKDYSTSLISCLDSICLASISGSQAWILPFSIRILPHCNMELHTAPSAWPMPESEGHGDNSEIVPSVLCWSWGRGWFPGCIWWEERISTSLLNCSNKESTDSSVSSPYPSLCLQRYLVTWCLSLLMVLQVNDLLSGWLLLQECRVQISLPTKSGISHPSTQKLRELC